MGRSSAYSTGLGTQLRGFSLARNAAGDKGVFFSVRNLTGIAGFVVLCVIVIPIIVHFARSPCSAGVTQTRATDATSGSVSDVTTISPSPPSQVKDIRLPTDVKPFHYSLTLAPFIYTSNVSDFYFTGSVNISVKVIRSTSNFKLHTSQLVISWPRIVDSNGRSVIVNSVEEDLARQWQSVTVNGALQAGSNYTIVIDRFSGPLKPDLHGLYLSSYTENGTTKYLVASQLEATDARKAFPCFDEPAFKAKFDVSLVRREDFKSISNMPSKTQVLVSHEDWFNATSGSGRMVREDFETTPIMSTYLLGFIVSQFEFTATNDSKGRLYRTWARPELVNSTQYASSAVIKVTEYFEDYFNITYPLRKTDQAAVPDFAAGAMENWGLVIYREIRLLLNGALDGASEWQYTARIISHEMAHMWFGNLVTPMWWDDLWLNEGFASFIQSLGVQKLHPEWDTDAQFVVQRQSMAFLADSASKSHPIYVEVNHPDEIGEIFDSITYNKGSSVLRMLYNSLGDEVFRVGVSNYLKNNSYSNTFHTALYQSLTQQANVNGKNIDVGEVMDRWIKQMGYPAVNCTRVNGQLLLSQQHFLSDASQTPDIRYPSPFNFTWIIPITMATNENSTSWNRSDVSRFVQWMREKSQHFSIDTTSWYLLNLRSTGFYRVNYDTNNWNALISQLLTDHTVFTPHDRARLLDDSFSLASAGYISYNIPLEMTRYLKNEMHLVPWKSALSKLSYIHSMLHRQSPEYGPFSAYMRSLLTPIFQMVGTQHRSTDSHLIRLTRELIVSAACRFGIKSCQSNMTSLFQSFINSNFRQRIEPDIRRTVLCVGIAHADEEEWNQLFSALWRESHPGIQNDIIIALACSRKPWLLNLYLGFTLDDRKLRRQDASSVISGVSKNPIGLQIVWDFLRNSWSKIHERQSGLFSLSRYINSLGDFNSEQRLREMEAFKAENLKILGSASRAMEMAIENVRINAKWMENALPAVREWLGSIEKV